MGNANYARRLQEIRDLEMGCSMIVASIDAAGDDVILKIMQSGKVSWEDEFATIGSGGAIAEAYLHQYEWGTDDVSLEECLYRIFSAKVAAEKNPQVGPATSFDILVGRERMILSGEAFAYLKQHVRPANIPPLKFPEGFLQKV